MAERIVNPARRVCPYKFNSLAENLDTQWRFDDG
jgi:hypothetical protein